MSSIRRNSFQAKSMLRATSAYKSAHQSWRDLEGFQICLCFCIKWMISAVSIPLPLLHCYCVFFCIFPSFCLFVPGRDLEPLPSCMGGLRCALCSVLCLQAPSLLGPWLGSGSRLFPVYIERCSSISYILYSSLRHTFPLSRALFSQGSSLTCLLYAWWQIFSVIRALCEFLCFMEREAKRANHTFTNFWFFLLCLVWWWRGIFSRSQIFFGQQAQMKVLFRRQEEHGWDMQRLGEHPP